MAEPFPVSKGGFIERDKEIIAMLDGRISTLSGAPVSGTNAVWTLTIGGTVTGGNIEFEYRGTEASANWSATNGTLLSNINTALDTLFGAANVNAAAGSLTSGIGTVLITFSNNLALQPVTGITIDSNLTGTNPTAVIANTTPGVRPSGYGTPTGGLIPTDDGLLYQNVGTSASPLLASVPQELRLPLTAATVTTAGAVLAIQNPYGVDVLIKGAGTFRATTPSNVARVISIGVAANGTTSATGFDIPDSNDAGIQSIGDPEQRYVWGASQWITGTANGSLAGMTGAYIWLPIQPL